MRLKDPDQVKQISNATVLEPGDNKIIKGKISNEEVKKYMKLLQEYEDNKPNFFKIVFGQYVDTLHAKLRDQDDWENIFSDKYPVKLMKGMQVRMLNQEGS